MDNPLETLLSEEEAAKDEHVEPQAEPAPPPAPQAPLAALLDERDKRQKAEQRAKEAEERWAEAQRASQPPPTPDERFEAQRYADNLRYSRKFAERQYGAERVGEAHDWALARCEADPFFNQQMRASDDPYEAAMQAYSREQILAKVGPDDLAAFEAWKSAQVSSYAKASEDKQFQKPAPVAAPPRSLADAPGSGAAGAPHVPVGDGEAYRSAIPR